MRAPRAEAVLLPADRPQPERARHGAARSGGGCWPPPPATRCRSSRTASTAASTTARGRVTPLKAADRAGRGHLHRHVLQDPVPGPPAGLAGGPAARSSSACKPPSSWPTCTRSALLQAAVHRFCERRLLDRHVGRVAAEYGAAARAAAGRAAAADAGRRDVDRAPGRLLAAAHAARRPRRHRRCCRGRSSAAWRSRPGPAFFVDGGGRARRCGSSFSSVSGGRIDEGVKRLAEAIRGRLRRPSARAG